MQPCSSALLGGSPAEAQALLAAIVEASDDAIIAKTLDGIIRTWNAGAERIFGYTAAEAVGKSINLIIPPELQDEEQRILAQLRRGERIEHYETVRVARDGRHVDVSLTVSPVRDETGRIVGASKIARDVTARKRAEERIAGLSEELKKRLEEHAALMRVLPVGIFLASDASCTQMTTNPAGARMLGIPQNLNPSKTGADGPRLGFRVLKDGQEVPSDELPMQRAARRREHVGGEIYEVVREDGASLWLFEYAVPLFDPAGNVRGCLGAFVDMTDQKRAEQDLARRAHEQAALFEFTDRLQRAGTLNQVFDAALDSITGALSCKRASILLFDDDGVMRFVGWRGLSDAYRQAVEGHSPWQPGEKNPQPFGIENIDTADVADPLKTVIRGEGICALGFIPLLAEGRLIGKFMVYYDVPHVFGDQELDLALTIGRQLAFGIERKRAEQALRESEERLRLATQTGKVGIWDWDISQNRVSWTDSLYAIHGLDKESFSATVEGFAALVHPDDTERVTRAIERSLAGEEPYELEFRSIRPDGQVIWLFTQAVVLRGGARPTRMIGATVDITAVKRAEEALRHADRRKDEFLATLAHELRNPLAPMMNSLALMKRTTDNPAILEQARATIERQTTQMVRLVDDLLDVSRITRDRLELRKSRVELASILQQAKEICGTLAECGAHDVEVILPPQPLYLDADPIRLAQIFSNLLNNACKYTQPAGRIRVSAERQGSDVVVSVKDNGIGIPPERLEGIFEMFVQVDTALERARGGLGIGLTLVRRLVELHGGSVTAHSEGPGRGSEFIVRLPLVIEAPKSAPMPPHADVPSTVSRRILVVDDNRDSADTLARLLRLYHHDVTTAYDGLEAVEVAEQFRPDLILLDIGLPGLNGYDAAGRIQQRLQDKRPVLVALTGWGQEEDFRRSKEAGFDAHLVKPATPTALLKLLASLPPPIEPHPINSHPVPKQTSAR